MVEAHLTWELGLFLSKVRSCLRFLETLKRHFMNYDFHFLQFAGFVSGCPLLASLWNDLYIYLSIFKMLKPSLHSQMF